MTTVLMSLIFFAADRKDHFRRIDTPQFGNALRKKLFKAHLHSFSYEHRLFPQPRHVYL